MQTTPKANTILGHFFALLGAVVLLAIATWVSASSSEQVKPLDNLAVPRTGHTATALSDGSILITGGRDADGNLVAASEIFDPETQTSSASASLNTARVDHSATVLVDGRVLVTGGTGASGALSSAEIFDPANPGAGFQVVASPMTGARSRHTATLLNNGTVLIVGGETGGTAEIFDPTTQSFTPTLWNLQVARSGHTATLFTDDSVLLAGGNSATMETYTPGQGFTLDPATLSVVRTGHWAFELSDTRLLLFQGDTGNTIDEFNPSTGTILPKGSLDFHASSSSLLANGKVLVLGTDVSGLYNPDAVPPAPDFTAFDETSVPHSGILARSGQAAVELPGDKKILITGGVDGNNQLLGQALFNPARIWTDKDDYMPEEPVILSASGWKANEAIYLFAVDNETEQWTYEMTVNADSNGEFILSPYFIVELRHLGVQFHVTAVGQSTMQADVYFTDAGANSVTVGAQTPSPVIAGNTATYPVTVGFNGNNNPCTVTLSVTSGLPAGATATFSPNPVIGPTPPVPPTLTITTTGATAGGTYNFTVLGTRGGDCQGGGANPTGNGTLVVTGLAGTTTAVSSSLNPSVYGDSVTFTSTVTRTSGSGTPTGSVNFNVAGIGTVAGTAGATTANTATWTYTTSALTAGNHSVSAAFTHTGLFQDSNGTLAGGQTVNKATPTATLAVSNSPQTYNGSGQAATVSITTSSVPGTVANILTGGSATKTNAGTYAVTANFVPNDTANYNTLTGLSAGNFVIQKATPTATLAVTNSPQTYTGSVQAATVGITVSSVPGAVANILTGGAATKTNAGTYAVTADFVPTDTTNYNTLTGLSAGNFVIQKATPTATLAVSNSPQTYNGLGQAATVGITVSSVPGAVANILAGGAATQTNAGTYAVTADFVPTDTTNYNTLTGLSAGSFVINKANATFTVTPYTCPTTTYTGLTHTATVSTITGVNGETGATVGTVDVTDTIHTAAGIYTGDQWFFTGAANYNDQSGTVDDCIAKANATVVVTPYTCPSTTYDGTPHTASYTLTGVNGETGATVGTVNVSNTTHTNAGTYAADYWFFTGTANYNDIGNTTITDCIAKANATVVVTPYTCPSTTYDGSPHTAAITSITGVNGETGATVGTVDVSNTTHTNAGTYAADYWFFTGTANYNDIGNTTITDCIDKATAVVVVNPYSVTYDGNPHSASVVSITGVNGETGATVGTVDVSNTTHTNAGTYAADYWFFTGTANYNNIGNTTITDQIDKATAVVVVNPYSVTYDGNPHSASVASITGVNGETGATVGTVDVSNTTHTNAGTFAADYWFFTGTANYNNIGNTTITDQIDKATAVVVVNPYSVTYDGNPHSASVVSITGVNGETGATVGTVDVSNTTHTNAGTYAADYWFFTGTANYNNIGNTTITDQIDKANATVVVTAYSVTYDGNPHSATIVSITGVNGETGATVGTVDVSNTTHTNAGTYAADYWFFTGTANYNNIGNTTITDQIDKATAVVVVNPYSVTYDGNPHSASVASITGVNGETGATVGTVDVSNTTHTNAGTFAVDYWFFTGTANYNNIGNTTITDQIDKANATVVVTAYSVTYDANPHTATYTITGVGTDTAAAGSSIDVSGTTHTGAGTYNGDPWSFNGGANYNNQNGTVDDFIGKANATVVVTAYNVTYDANPHTATYTITGVGTDTAAAGSSIDVSGTTHTGAGTYNGDPWSFNGGANYNNQNGTVDDFIGKANATVVVTAYSVTYDANPHTATYTITGVGTDTAAAGSSIDVSGTTHTGAGTYNGDPWSFNGGANYNNQNGTVDDYIGKANAMVVVTPYSVTYDTFSHTATVTSITGVGGESGATVGTVDVSNTVHTAAGTYAADYWTFTGTANYNDITVHQMITDQIDKANAMVVVTPYSVTYDTFSHTATVTSITGVGGESGATVGTVDVSNTVHTNAGTYTADYWFFTGTGNYNDIGNTTITDQIDKANAVVVVNSYSVTYDSSSHTATVVSITGVNGETGATVGIVDVSNTVHTNAGTYAADYWFFTGTGNYNDIGNTTITDQIDKANATVVVTAYSVTYDSNPHTATYTITGVGTDTTAAGSSINVSGTTHTNAGTYNGDPWSFNGGTNYNNQSGTVDDFIDQANATVTANSITKIYGQTVTFAGTEFTTSGFLGSDAVTSVMLTSAGAAGTATVTAPGPNYAIVPSAAVGTGLGNYMISYINGNLHVNPATLTITATNRTKTYGATYTPDTTPPSVDFNLSGLVNSDSVTSITLSSGGYAASATFTAPGPDYTVTPSAALGTGLGNYTIGYVIGNIHVNQATLTITATNRSKVFGATYTPDTTPPSVDFNVTGLLNSDTVTNVTLTCAGYAASATVTPPGPTYPIVPNNAVGTGIGNYTIGYLNGTFTINAWTITGFYQPVDMGGVVNTVKGGSTVPLKFNIYAGGVEKTSVSDVMYQSVQVGEYTCGASSEVPLEEVANTGATNLRYDTTGHQFIQNWQTPRGANKCYVVRMTALDGSHIDAYFKTK